MPVPKWLRKISELCSVMQQQQQCGEEEEEEAAEEAAEQRPLLLIPVGAPPISAYSRTRYLECLYITLAYFAVPFEKVPLHFLERWFRYRDAASRQALLEQYGAYRMELDSTRWLTRMFKRDDARMMSAVLSVHRQFYGADDKVYSVQCVGASVDHGAIHCLEWLYENRPSLSERANFKTMARRWLVRAARIGRVAIFHSMREHWAWDDDVPSTGLWRLSGIGHAMNMCRHLPMLQYAHEHGWSKNRAAFWFANSGYTEGLEWLRSVNAPGLGDAYSGATKVEVLEYLWTHDWPPPDAKARAECISDVIVRGNAIKLRWIRDHGWQYDAFTAAAVLRRCRITDTTELCALLDAMFDDVRFPNINAGADRQIESTTLCVAAIYGNRSVEMVQWLVERGHVLSYGALAGTVHLLCYSDETNNGISLLEWISAAHPHTTSPVLLSNILNIYSKRIPFTVIEWIIVVVQWPCYNTHTNCLYDTARNFVLCESPSHFTTAEWLHLLDVLFERGCPIGYEMHAMVFVSAEKREEDEIAYPNRALLKAWLSAKYEDADDASNAMV